MSSLFFRRRTDRRGVAGRLGRWLAGQSDDWHTLTRMWRRSIVGASGEDLDGDDGAHGMSLVPLLPGRAEQLGALARWGRAPELQGLWLVRDGVAELPQKHAALIRTTFNWLGESFSPRVEDLYERLPYSQRQAQRLIVRFFGQPPATLVRRYRAIRAASLLALPRLAPEVIAELREAYYDQAHFIRDIREFTGRTPRALGPKEDTVVKDMLGPEGYGMVDLIAKGEADSDSAAS